VELLGIDIGGTGIKGAPVDVETGILTADRVRLLTPQPAEPKAVAEVVAEVVGRFSASGAVGATFPAVIRAGRAETAANVDPSWIGEDVAARLGDAAGRPFVVLNDADAAGLAEMRFGAGRGRQGVVVMVTLGTGIGTAVFVDGKLVPNTELGHLELGGREAEKWAADSVRERKGLSWQKWGKRVDEYLRHLEMLLSPDLFVLGGGASKKSAKFFPSLGTRAEVVPAQLLNEAGIVGAAVAAADPGRRPPPPAGLGVAAGSPASGGAGQTSWTSPGSTSPS
jgi:polyphosphate glucokinase